VDRVKNPGMPTLKAKASLGGGKPPRSSHNQNRPTATTDYGDDEQDIYEDEDDDGATPGPGYYFNQGMGGDFRKGGVNPNQYFGSTVERFVDNNAKIKNPPNLGPGSYHRAESGNKNTK
jgi:hypothetical protein